MARRSLCISRTQATAEFKLPLVTVFKLALLGDAFPDFPVGIADNHVKNKLVSAVPIPRPGVYVTLRGKRMAWSLWR
jgi:hypothetical protein